jgi:hypothetical protein
LIVDEKYYNPHDERFREVVGFLTLVNPYSNELQEIVGMQVKHLHFGISLDVYTLPYLSIDFMCPHLR